MGIRIHKAVGWGLTDQQFRENLGFEIEDNDLFETLYDKLNSITELVVPERSVSKIFEDWRGFIAEPNLLATKFGKNKTLQSANSLYQSISNYDEPADVHLFLPHGLRESAFFRYDDTLDYIEATHNLQTGEYADDPCEYLLTELAQNPYPWNSDFMDADGNIIDAPFGKYDRTKIFPRPPAELRWWLTEMGILKQDAWKLLRPYYARWWG